MYEISDKSGTVKAKLWLPPDSVETSAMQQIENMMTLPFLHKWVAIMPDVHSGIGATIGSVLPCEGALIPSAVGVDIGCGMCSVKSDLNIAEITPVLKKIHDQIVRDIPMGFSHRPKGQLALVHEYADNALLAQLPDYDKKGGKATAPQLGTLGGGNHFIELQADENNTVWIMLHSGSRNIGKELAERHMKAARRVTQQKNWNLPSQLDALDELSPEGEEYIDDMNFAMEFARQNRFVMMECIKDAIRSQISSVQFDPIINIHHNYAAQEKHFGKNVWVHRKGATRVKTDITGIIPGSMADPSYIVQGKDNEDSFNSCSHGAGRRMSRHQAKKSIPLEKFRSQMEGIFSESVSGKFLDEAPDAYKNIDDVMSQQTDLVTITTKLRPILNIKG